MDTIGKEIEKRNKQNLFISQCLLLPEKIIIVVKLQNNEKNDFSLTSRGTPQDCWYVHGISNSSQIYFVTILCFALNTNLNLHVISVYKKTSPIRFILIV